MGAVTGFLGLGGGANGTGFGGPSALPTDPTGMTNLESTYNQLGQVAAGQGPNPAMAQYNQNVQNLAKQQAGAISSVQGISPALATRMISQQGSGAMQNAAAAGATMQAQQQLGALGQQGALANSQAQIAAGLQQNVNNANAGLAQSTMQGQQGFIGGGLNGLGSTGLLGSGIQNASGGAAAAALAKGGEVPSLGPKSLVGKHLMAKGGRVPAMVSPGEAYLSPGKVQKFAQGGQTPQQMLKGAEKIPGKAKVPGNSYANDTVKKELKPGGIVVPRDKMQSKNPSEAAARFVEAVLAKKGKKK